MEDRTLFENGEIIRIRTQARDYDTQDFILGVASGGSMLAAIDRQEPGRVKFIPISAVLELEVDYGESQAAGKD